MFFFLNETYFLHDTLFTTFTAYFCTAMFNMRHTIIFPNLIYIHQSLNVFTAFSELSLFFFYYFFVLSMFWLSWRCSLTVTVIGTLLIAVWLLLDGPCWWLDCDVFFSFFSISSQANCQEREKERGRLESGRGREGEKEKDSPSISTRADAAFIRSTIGKRETLTGLNFSLIVTTPPTTPVSPSLQTPPPRASMHSFFLVFFPLSWMSGAEWQQESHSLVCWFLLYQSFSYKPQRVEQIGIWYVIKLC